MQPNDTTDRDSGLPVPNHPVDPNVGAEPQRRLREQSGMLGELPSAPADAGNAGEGSGSGDPLHEKAPDDGVDHWRR